jgi:hypothetical protein
VLRWGTEETAQKNRSTILCCGLVEMN